MIVSSRTLKILAAVVWYAGGVVLMLKGGSLLFEAKTLRPEQDWTQLAALAGLCVGGLKAKFLFYKICRKNVARIDALTSPKVWEFFRPRFFAFLIVMILFGPTLSRLAQENYPLLIGVAILDLSIATALLASGFPFWRRESFVK